MCAWTIGGVVNILTVRYACWGRTPLDGARCCPRCSRHACRPLTPSQPHTDPTTLPPFMCMLLLADALSANFNWHRIATQPRVTLQKRIYLLVGVVQKKENGSYVKLLTAVSLFIVYCLQCNAPYSPR